MSAPDKAIDPIVIAAEMVGVLQTLISRHKAPIDTAVLTVTQIHAGSGELSFYRAYPPLVNHDAQVDFAAEVAERAFGVERVRREIPPTGGAEDFSFYPQEVPGAYLFVGNGEGDHREARYHGMGPCQLHNPNYDFNDTLLSEGATYWVRLVGT